jgi:hypothetical protein
MAEGSRFYEAREAMPEAERREHADARVRWIAEHAFRNAPALCMSPGPTYKKVDQRDHLTLSYQAGDQAPPAEAERSLLQRFKEACRLNLGAIERVARGTMAPDGKPIVDERPQGEK